MKVSSVNNPNFNKVVETFRKDKEESKEPVESKNTYEYTIVHTETIKVPQCDETLQKINYMV